MSDLNARLADLAAKAEAATGAPWHRQPMYTSHRATAVWGGANRGEVVCECGGTVYGTRRPQDIHNAAHIAANSPAVTLAFVEVARAAPSLIPCDQCSDGDMPPSECGIPRAGDIVGVPCRIMPLRAALAALAEALEENRG